MPIDTFKPKGQIAADKPGKGGSGVQAVPLIGVVRDNIDPTRSGRIRVSLVQPNSSDKPEDSTNWITVSYLSTFFGKVESTSGSDGYGTYKSNPSSYGQWQAPPDIGTQVVCVFVNGDKNYGYYIGAIPEAESLQMVPAIGSSDNILVNEGEATSYGGATRLPVTNLNTNDKKKADSAQFLSTPRPVHSYSAAIMNQQGIIRDPIRGPISSSASREPASRVGWGVSTPGRPIYTGGYDDTTLPASLQQASPQGLQVVARRGGHSIVMDDGDIIGRDQLIRIRTALGHQIMMSDDGQTLMILHSNGQSYIELGKEGTIDMYSTNSVNIRTQGDLNLHADRDINLHAMNNLNIQAKQIHTNSEDSTLMRSAGNFSMSATKDITGLAAGAVAFASGGDASLAAGGQAYVNGSKVNLNSGQSSTTPEAVPNIPLVAQTDTLYDEEKGFMAAPGKLLSIVSRAPAHAPWSNAGQGVDVKTNLDASAALPAAPSASTAAATAAGSATGATPPAVATVASAPNSTPAASAALDKGTTSAMVAAQATSAAAGPLAAATKQGSAIVTTATGPIAAIGAFALTPSSLAQGGILKPGADILVNGLVQQGANLAKAMPPSLFTGIGGVGSLSSLTSNMTAQVGAVVTNMQKAQTGLGMTGALTGSESPSQVAGLVQAAATTGIASTTAAIQQVSGVASSVTGAISAVTSGPGLTSSLGAKVGSLSGGAAGITNAAAGAASGAVNQISGALAAIGSGVAAAGLSASLGGLGGIASALTAMGKIPSLAGLLDQAKGVAASAFAAIKNSFVPLKAGVPQNLTAIAHKAAATASEQSSQTSQESSSVLSSVTSGVNPMAGSSAIGGLSSVAGKVTGIKIGALTTLASATGSVSGAVAAVNNSVGGITGSVTSAASIISAATRATNIATDSLGSVRTTIGGVTGISSVASGSVSGYASLSSIAGGSSSIGNPLNPTVSGLETAIGSISAISGAGAMISSGNLGGLSTAASFVQQGSAASTASSLASGLSNLPGGINTVSSVINNAPNAINLIPGAGALSGLINNAKSAAMSGISLADSLTGKLGSLTSIASSGLSVGSIAQLQSSITSLSSGPGGINLPTVGFNTTDRTAITSQITDVLSDPGIPSPNLVGSIPDTAVSSAQSLIDQGDKLTSLADQLLMYNEKAQAALDAYITAQQTLPTGDSQIESLSTAYYDIVNDPTYISLKKQVNGSLEATSTTVTEAGTTITTLTNNAQTRVTTTTNSSTQTSSSLEVLQASVGANKAATSRSLSGTPGSVTGIGSAT